MAAIHSAYSTTAAVTASILDFVKAPLASDDAIDGDAFVQRTPRPLSPRQRTENCNTTLRSSHEVLPQTAQGLKDQVIPRRERLKQPDSCIKVLRNSDGRIELEYQPRTSWLSLLGDKITVSTRSQPRLRLRCARDQHGAPLSPQLNAHQNHPTIEVTNVDEIGSDAESTPSEHGLVSQCITDCESINKKRRHDAEQTGSIATGSYYNPASYATSSSAGHVQHTGYSNTAGSPQVDVNSSTTGSSVRKFQCCVHCTSLVVCQQGHNGCTHQRGFKGHATFSHVHGHLNKYHNMLFCMVCWETFDTVKQWKKHVLQHRCTDAKPKPTNFYTAWPGGRVTNEQLWQYTSLIGQPSHMSEEDRWYIAWSMLHPDHSGPLPSCYFEEEPASAASSFGMAVDGQGQNFTPSYAQVASHGRPQAQPMQRGSAPVYARSVDTRPSGARHGLLQPRSTLSRARTSQGIPAPAQSTTGPWIPDSSADQRINAPDEWTLTQANNLVAYTGTSETQQTPTDNPQRRYRNALVNPAPGSLASIPTQPIPMRINNNAQAASAQQHTPYSSRVESETDAVRAIRGSMQRFGNSLITQGIGSMANYANLSPSELPTLLSHAMHHINEMRIIMGESPLG